MIDGEVFVGVFSIVDRLEFVGVVQKAIDDADGLKGWIVATDFKVNAVDHFFDILSYPVFV